MIVFWIIILQSAQTADSLVRSNVSDSCIWEPVNKNKTDTVHFDMHISPFKLKLRNTVDEKRVAMLTLCSDNPSYKCDIVIIEVLTPTSSRISILRSGECNWDYEYENVPPRSAVVWQFRKRDFSMEIACEGGFVARASFSNFSTAECRLWREEYNTVTFRDKDTASIAYCDDSGEQTPV